MRELSVLLQSLFSQAAQETMGNDKVVTASTSIWNLLKTTFRTTDAMIGINVFT